jgi:hypothetical protein
MFNGGGLIGDKYNLLSILIANYNGAHHNLNKQNAKIIDIVQI